MTAILRLMEAPWLNLLRAAASHDEGRPLILALATVDAAEPTGKIHDLPMSR